MSYDDYEPSQPTTDHSVTLTPEVVIEWNQEEMIHAIVHTLSDRLYDDVKPTVSKIISEMLGALVNEALSEVLESEIQPTDNWGAPKGPAISIRALLQRDAETWLTEQVDQYGGTTDRYRDRHPRIHWLFQEALNGKKDSRGSTMLQALVLKTVKETIGDVTAVVEQTVREQARKALKLQ